MCGTLDICRGIDAILYQSQRLELVDVQATGTAVWQMKRREEKTGYKMIMILIDYI